MDVARSLHICAPNKIYHVRPYWQIEDEDRKAITLDPDATFLGPCRRKTKKTPKFLISVGLNVHSTLSVFTKLGMVNN